ncbi:MAG: polymerase sigma factor, sigma-70 family [Labilithrix sp.]|nr:polymerase sigma factor, sigma-70 family [Labilithrix sp.]
MGTNEHELAAPLQAHHEASFGWAMACCGRRRLDAEDVLQDVYAKVLSGRAVFRGESTFRTWLFGVIRITALEHQRWRWARRREVLVSEHADAPASAPRVDRETAEALGRALAQVAPRQREALHLVFYEGLTIEEASVVMGVALGTARVHYERGKAAVLAILQRQGVTL